MLGSYTFICIVHLLRGVGQYVIYVATTVWFKKCHALRARARITSRPSFNIMPLASHSLELLQAITSSDFRSSTTVMLSLLYAWTPTTPRCHYFLPLQAYSSAEKSGLPTWSGIPERLRFFTSGPSAVTWKRGLTIPSQSPQPRGKWPKK